ncbi:MAG: prepilin-type N-terminal cleavage/methylation domain-containing protein, partial [Planctomycetota bacterium]|nr:prepilin-type N-terminal cleavage/methylation domain-containing protein [Planctomycetota bacterium]
MNQRRAFTLFEVLIAMLVMAIAVLAVAGILPSGIKAQEQARYQLYASALALEILHTQANDGTTHYGTTHPENQAYGTGMASNRNSTNLILANNIELSFRSLKPLPGALAGRLSSDGDEIAQILAGGGQIYYANGQQLRGQVRDADYNLADETIGYKMLCAVKGAPQNPLIRHPEIAWPYRDALLAPPVKQMDQYYDSDLDLAFGGTHRYQTSPGS